MNARPTFICGDAFKVLKKFEDNSVDIILTDPPYKEEDIVSDGLDYYEFLSYWFSMAKRVAKDYIIFFNNANRLYDILQLLEKPFRILMWTKPGSKFNSRYEPVFIYPIDPDFNINSRIWSDILPFSPITKAMAVHPYEKPLPLMENLVRYIPPQKSVLDTFCGSGTTNLACMKFGLKSIGIDIKREYIEIARERCKLNISTLEEFEI